MDPQPAAARVTLRVEFADGQVREFTAPKPHKVEVKIYRPDWPWWPDAMSPLAVTDGQIASVEMKFEASPDPQYPIAVEAWAGDERVTVSREALRTVLAASLDLADDGTVAAAVVRLQWALTAPAA